MISVVDASAAVEYLLRTDVGEHIAPVLEAGPLSAPELLDAEVLAVLRREVAGGRLAARRAADAIEDLATWDLERVTHRELLKEAWRLRGRVTAYDALYVATARLRNAVLVTADGPLARAPGLGIVVHNVRLQG